LLRYGTHSACYAGLKQWKEAAQDAKECIRLNPEFMKGYYRLATTQLEMEEYEMAQATIKQGLTLDANNSQLLKVLRSIKQAKKAADNASNAKQKQADFSLPTANGRLDTAASRELYDLQVQHSQTVREYNTAQANLTKSQREHKMQEITHKELQEQPAESACYRTIGKVFVKSTRGNVLDHIQSNMDLQQKKQADMTQKLDYLERRIKSQQQNMQELVSSNE
jgi:chaperonin cofactor prefoldin